MKKLFLFAALLLATVANAQTQAQTQSVRQGGSITPRRAPAWLAPGVIGDAGTAQDGILTGVGVNANTPYGFCANSGPITAAHNRLCLGATSTAGLITFDNIGGGTGPLNIVVNGTAYAFPFSVGGIVGPGTTTIGHIASWNNGGGTLLGDTGTLTTTSGGTALAINPASDQLGTAYTQSGSGTNSGNITGPFGFGFGYNTMLITDSRADFGTSPFTYGQQIILSTGGPASRGSKIGFSARAIRTAPSNVAVAYGDMIGGLLAAQASIDDGGTNTGAGARGTIFGAAVGATAGAGATNYFVVSGAEVDVGINTGASAQNRLGWSITGNGNLNAAQLDAALEISAANPDPGWKTGLLFSSFHGAKPITVAGTLIGTDGVAQTVAHGIDWSAYTFSSDIIKGPNFRVDNNGNVALGGTFSFQFVSLAPTGATTIGDISQFGDDLSLALHNTSNWLSINLPTGRVTIQKTLQLVPTTVGALPAAATAGAGAKSFVTDSNQTLTAGIGTPVATGGANVVPVYSDGVIWRIGG